MTGIWIRRLARYLAFTALVSCGPAMAQAPEDYYRGKTVRLVNGGSAGSGYDLYSRMIAPWLAKRIGANVVVDSRPGAGMMIALNYTWAAPPDGLTIMLAPGEDAVLANLLEAPGARFDAVKFSMLAGVNTAPRVLIVNPKLPWQTFSDLLKSNKVLQIGGNGRADAPTGTAAVMCHALEIPCKMTIGYPSSKEFAYAAVTGEVDGTVLADDSAAIFSKGDQLRPLVVSARSRSLLMPDVPTIFEAAPERMNARAAWWIDFRESVRKVGRVLVAPPNTPLDRVQFLREAAKHVLNDPLARAEFEAKGQPVLYGEPDEMSDLLRKVLGGLSSEQLTEVRYVMTTKYY